MIFFSAKWNNNLLIVVNVDNDVNLIVYEMPMQNTANPAGGDLRKFLAGGYNSSYNALNEARELERKLKYSDNPILAYKHGLVTINYEKNCNSSFFPMTFRDGTVKRTELPSDAKYNPDKYIKPLDVVLTIDNNNDMVHSCVYLGDKNICHVIAVNKKGIVKIDNWSKFVNLISTDKILSYHPLIAFKKPDTIIRHIAKSVEGTDNYFVPGMKNTSGRLSIRNDSSGRSNNCENFTNVCVLGLNFSELNDRETTPVAVFNSELCIDETTRKLDNLSSYPSSKISEIKGYVSRGNNNRVDSYVDREGIEMDERIEVQPHNLYRLNNKLEVVDILTLGLGRLFIN